MNARRMVSLVLTLWLVAETCAAGGDEAEAVKKAVLVPQEAGWGRHDFTAYMSQWTDKAQLVVARAEKPGPHDTVFNLKQIEATRRLLMSVKPQQGKKITFDNIKVRVNGDEAELRLRSTLVAKDNQEVADEIFLLKKTAAGWKVYLNRGWMIQAVYGKDKIVYDADTWRKLDDKADKLVRSGKSHDEAVEALMSAFRFTEAHALAKKQTERKDATASDWLVRGAAAMTAGDADDALAAFRRARKLDDKIVVPEFVPK